MLLHGTTWINGVSNELEWFTPEMKTSIYIDLNAFFTLSFGVKTGLNFVFSLQYSFFLEISIVMLQPMAKI